MSSSDSTLEKLIKAVEDNLTNENFGVSEMAELLSMSKSTLLRTVKKHSSVSVNQFIKDIRLEHAKNKLEETEASISEIAFQTGFSSPSYFIKCYREKYGIAPGEDRKTQSEAEDPIVVNIEDNLIEKAEKDIVRIQKEKKFISKSTIYLSLLILLITGAAAFYIYFNQTEIRNEPVKSIAVLPFKNESSDSSNIYFVNGMMETLLNNLQKISDLRVISRTSVEQYRSGKSNIREIADELDVRYIVEGSGQKVGDEILLTVQLIDAETDKHIWSEQYKRSFSNVFDLQIEIANHITGNIQAVIQPEEMEQIQKIPTKNLQAYDSYLKGIDFLKSESVFDLDSALKYFKSAIDQDKDFAEAYAYAGITFYYMDLFKSNKSYLEDLDIYSDKAILLDSKLPLALISKGLYYMLSGKYESAVEYFEKVIKIAPNSAWTHNFLAEIYHRYLPDTEKYLVHALTVTQLDYSKNDSFDLSISHLILANALAQSGMIEKAKEQVEISLDFDSTNTFSLYLNIYLDMLMGEGLDKTIDRMHKVYERDTTRLDVLKELGKLYYANKDYKSSYNYYKKLHERRRSFGINLFEEENIAIAYVARKVGDDVLADELSKEYKVFTDNSSTTYKDLQYAFYYAYQKDYDKALESFENFSKEEDIMFWIVDLIDKEEIFGPIADKKRFKDAMKKIRNDFEENKLRRTKMLKDKGLM